MISTRALGSALPAITMEPFGSTRTISKVGGGNLLSRLHRLGGIFLTGILQARFPGGCTRVLLILLRGRRRRACLGRRR